MIVLDASATVDLLVHVDPLGEWVAERIVGEREVHAPELLDAEVLHALRRRVLREELTELAARQSVADLLDLPIVRYPHRPFVERAWGLRGALSPYDALYVALAETLGGSLVTTDLRLGRTVSTVDVVSPP